MLKKLTFIALALFTVVSMFSCKKETVVQQNPAASIYAYITPNQWVADNANGYYYYDIDMSTISGYLYTQDGTLVYGGSSNVDPTNSSFSPTLSLISGEYSDGTWIGGLQYTWDLATATNGSTVVPSLRIYVNGANGAVTRPTTNMYFNIVVFKADDYGQAQKYKDNYTELKKAFNLK